jgi:hypothetical protein
MKIKAFSLLTFLLLAGCSNHKGHLTIINGSHATLTNIIASGKGFSAPVDQMPPGAKESVAITPDPNGQAGLKLDFDAGGKHFSWSREGNTWDGAKEVILTIDPQFSVHDEIITSF